MFKYLVLMQEILCSYWMAGDKCDLGINIFPKLYVVSTVLRESFSINI